VDKAELCASLLTWVGRGRAGDRCAPPSLTLDPRPAVCTSALGLEGVRGLGLLGRWTLA
jgi:hypothetical protein